MPQKERKREIERKKKGRGREGGIKLNIKIFINSVDAGSGKVLRQKNG